MKKVFAAFSAALLLLLCSCASNKPAVPILSRTWNGIEVKKSARVHGGADMTAANSVLTVGENALELSAGNRDGLGHGWFVQVKLDGVWFDIPNDSQMEPVISPGSNADSKTLSFDLSGLGLPAGEYRITLKYSLPSFWDKGYLSMPFWVINPGDEIPSASLSSGKADYITAPFWVINPGDEIPSASLTSGEADPADIVVSVSSAFPARLDITDADNVIILHIENLSGKNYTHSRLKLERLGSGEPETIKYEHANMGLIQAWMQDSNSIFLNEPLAPGKYRLTPSLYSGSIPFITPEIEFQVIKASDAPDSVWSSVGMYPSVHAEPSERVRMSISDATLGGDKTELHVSLDCDINYQYGEFFMLETNLGGQWFTVPGAYGIGYFLLAYSTSNRSDFVLDLKHSHGILPTGQYRLVMEFDESEYSSSGEFVKYLSKEFAFAEFEITKPIIANPFANSFK